MSSIKVSSNLKCFSGSLKSITKADLNLKACLLGGMSFRWKAFTTNGSDSYKNHFVGVINKRIYLLEQTQSQIDFISYSSSNEDDASEIENELRDYFRLSENLKELYEYWSKRDEKFLEKTKLYPDVLNGIRVLRLSPVENLFSFICSSNNNIKRITQMVSNMCSNFGKLIGSLDGVDYYQFPTVNRLAERDSEEKLRKLSFGYRAKFIHQAAVYISENHPNQEEKWLYSLRNEKSYELVHKELTKIPGIGKKVADCICLMSMDKLEAIPVDTHVLSLARTIYKFAPSTSSSSKNGSTSKTATLTDKSYKEIADKFRELWGNYSGWAQTIMFIDDLKSFQKDKEESSSSESKITLNIKKEEMIEIKGNNKRIKNEPVEKNETTHANKRIKTKLK